MLIKLIEIVVCLCLCFPVTISYIYSKSSERTPKKHVFPKTVTSNFPDSYNKQSRYSKFDKVMTRINKMNFDDEVVNEGVYKLRHKGWSNSKPVVTTTPSITTTIEMDLFETYGEMENEDYLDDYEDTLDDEEDEFEYEEEEDNENLFEEIQAEEPTEKPTSTSAPRPVSKLTEYKWNHFGTREKVEESMRHQLNLNPIKEQLNVKAVIEHYARVNQQSKCKNPLPRVISVQQEHSDPTRSYIPACTVLYRCAEDSGCCKRDTRCQYKTRELVSLYFYAKVIGQDHNTIEKLEFYNHTECTCKERTDLTQSVKDSDTKNAVKFSERVFHNRTSEKSNERCNCPKPYQAMHSTPKCTCDCDKSEKDCIQLKKGKEHFSMINRICIQDSECGLPTCEYGAYLMSEGKCPTKQDKLEEYRKMRIKI